MACIPFISLLNGLQVKQLVWKSGQFYHSEIILKNVSEHDMNMKIVCKENGVEQIYNILIPFESERKIKLHDIFAPFLSAEYICEYYERN